MQTEQEEAKQTLYNLLYYLLVDLRAASSGDLDGQEVFFLTNLFHNLPHALAKENPDYIDLLVKLKQGAEATPQLSEWFAFAI